VPKNGWKYAFRIGAGQGKCIRMANTGGHHSYQDFTVLGSLYVYLGYFKWFTCLNGNSGA